MNTGSFRKTKSFILYHSLPQVMMDRNFKQKGTKYMNDHRRHGV